MDCYTSAYPFVLTSDTTSGDLGGLEGAHTFCQNYVDQYSSLPEGDYKAWLCDSTECVNLAPNRDYEYHYPSDSQVGTTFNTDSQGRGPGDNLAWNTEDTFGDDPQESTGGGPATGRDSGDSSDRWSLNPYTGETQCNDWTTNDNNNALTRGDFNDGTTDDNRWHQRTDLICGWNTVQIICFLDQPD